LALFLVLKCTIQIEGIIFFLEEVTDHDKCETPYREVPTDKKVILV
jgi:hypothetical protein